MADFDRQVKRILNSVLLHEAESVKAARDLLRRVHTEVLAEIAKGGSEFDLMVLRRLVSAIELRIADFQRELNRVFEERLRGSIKLGEQMADTPLRSAAPNLHTGFGVSSQTAQVAAQYSARLINGLGRSLQEKIDSILTRAALGGLKPSDAINQIGSKFNSKSIGDGPFKSIFSRAETIVRTEVLRIQSIATHARLLAQRESLKRSGYTLRKRWLSAHDPRVRPSHLAADGQVQELEEPFLVGGEELIYPRDPNGSGGNTVRCRCIEAPVIEKAA